MPCPLTRAKESEGVLPTRHWRATSREWHRAVTSAPRFCGAARRGLVLSERSAVTTGRSVKRHRAARRLRRAHWLSTSEYLRRTRRRLGSVGEDFSWATSRRHLSGSRLFGSPAQGRLSGSGSVNLRAAQLRKRQRTPFVRKNGRAAWSSGSRGIDLRFRL